MKSLHPIKNMYFLLLVFFLFSCKNQAETPFLKVETMQVSFSFEQGLKIIACSSNAAIETVSSNPEWCTANVTEWKNNSAVEITVSQNTTVGKERTAIVTVSAGKTETVDIEVKQAAAAAFFTVHAASELKFASQPAQQQFTVAANVPFTVTPSPSWCTTVVNSDATLNNVTVFVTNNDNIVERTAEIVIASSGFEDVIVPVYQEGFISEENLHGYISTDGKPIPGVVVSDGFQCVITDERGVYQMNRTNGATFVFYSTPAEYGINTESQSLNAAVFYTALDPNIKRYDFTLTKLPAVETEFNLLCIADPQVANVTHVARYTNETVPDFKAFSDDSNKPCYGLVLGDITSDQPQYFTQMRTLTGSTDMKFFATIGNHDKTGGNAGTPRNADEYCAVFGPLDYSFNRGNVHFVCLDNVVFSNSSTYSGGFEDHQIEWLKQDLSFVPKDKLIIVFYHVPIRNTSNIKNRTELLNVLRDFDKVHLMCGHTHYNENFIITSPATIYEHIHGAVCGSWWFSNINTDGAPNGYAIYEVQGTELTNWYYKPTRYDKGFQIRLHRGDTQFGGSYGSFSYNQGNNIVANIWNADSDWTIEAYEDGVHAGQLTKLSQRIDAFAAGFHVGVLNRNPDTYKATGSGTNKHAYLHTLKNPDAQVIEIRAADKFGNVYKQSEIISTLTSAGTYP